ncbi:MAG: hypothetical protein ACLSA6_18200 [Holdemania massiliensis]
MMLASEFVDVSERPVCGGEMTRRASDLTPLLRGCGHCSIKIAVR